MKKIYVLILCFYSTTSFSQIKNIPATADSSVMIDNLYAGILSWNETRVDSFSVAAFATVRVGAMATLKLSKKFSCNLFGIYETDGRNEPLIIAQYRLQYQPSKRWKILIGNMATPTTEQRPVPPTAGGQFETNTMSKIPGLTPGVKTSYALSTTTTATVGYALRKGAPEYHIALGTKHCTTAMYYQPQSNTVGVVNTVETKRIYSISVYQSNKVVSNTFVYSFGKALSVYNDCAYDIHGHTLENAISGIIRKFESKIVSGLLSFSYDSKKSIFVTCFFVHL